MAPDPFPLICPLLSLVKEEKQTQQRPVEKASTIKRKARAVPEDGWAGSELMLEPEKELLGKSLVILIDSVVPDDEDCPHMKLIQRLGDLLRAYVQTI